MWRLILALSIALLWMFPGLGSAEERHSGQIVAINPGTATLVLKELSASGSDAPARVTRTIELTPDTHIEMLQRSENASTSEWPGGFTASECAAADLHPGDFITVTVSEHAGRMRASAVDVVRTDSFPSASPR